MKRATSVSKPIFRALNIILRSFSAQLVLLAFCGGAFANGQWATLQADRDGYWPNEHATITATLGAGASAHPEDSVQIRGTLNGADLGVFQKSAPGIYQLTTGKLGVGPATFVAQVYYDQTEQVLANLDAKIAKINAKLGSTHGPKKVALVLEKAGLELWKTVVAHVAKPQHLLVEQDPLQLVVKIDQTAPTVSVLPASGAQFTQPLQHVTITVQDSESGVDPAAFQVFLNQGDVTRTFSWNGNTAQGDITFSPNNAGNNALIVLAADVAGNLATLNAQYVLVSQVQPPTALSYSAKTAVFTKGTAITPDVPSNSGGAVASYSISPALPAGLNFNTTTGVISGTPTAVSSTAPYVVTASNSGGSASVTITLSVAPVSGLPGTSAIAAGASHSCAVVNGGVLCWGSNSSGQLGNGSTTSSNVPVPVPGLTSGVTAIAAGGNHTCAIVNGGVWCWGSNSFGHRGRKSMLDNNVPTPVPGLSSGVTAVAAGYYHICAVVGGSAQCWGENTYGQLGNGSTTGADAPVQVQGLSSGVTAIAAGGYHSCAIANDGVLCWGFNGSGELGDGLTANSDVPVQAQGLISGATVVAAGGEESCAIVNSILRCWGNNAHGQLGNGSKTNSDVPVPVYGLSEVFTVTVGNSYTCALLPPALTNIYDIAWCWGSNGFGELGNGTTNDGWVPSPVQMFPGNASAVAVGSGQSCAIVNGGVLCWGNNSSGQLGDGSNDNSDVPTPVSDVAPANLVYSANPAVYTVGQAITPNVPSSIGGPVTGYSISPALPPGLSFNATTGVISGTPTEVSASTSYEVTASNSSGQATDILILSVKPVADVPPVIVYSPSSFMFTMGDAVSIPAPTNSGGPVVVYSVSPELPPGLSLDVLTGAISGVPSSIVAAASYAVIAVNSGGSSTANVLIGVNDVAPSNLAYSMNPATYAVGSLIANNTPTNSGGAVTGYSISPALPVGFSFDTSTGVISGTPTEVSASTPYQVTASNSGGQTTVTVLMEVRDLAPVISYSPSSFTLTVGIAALIPAPANSGGAVVSYSISPTLPAGLNLNTTTGVISGMPTASSAGAPYVVTASNLAGPVSATITIGVVPVPAVSAIATGTNHTCALVNGGVRCWGLNNGGQLGNNSMTDSHVPVQVQGLISGVTAIAAGDAHSCAVVNGTGLCWGWNSYGELGNGSTTYSLTPVEVQGLHSGVTAITAGYYHSCAVINGGSRCWGNNGQGQLGNGSGIDSHVSVQVQGLTGVTAISSGYSHNCVIADGKVQCWGTNGQGQLGNGTSANAYTPVMVQGLTSGITAIASGLYHTCAVVNGGVQCWGGNGFGQLGNGSMGAPVYIPTQVQGLISGVTSVAAGKYHTCAIVNGGVQCWGDNRAGELGNPSQTYQSLVPVPVLGLNAGVTAIAVGEMYSCASGSGFIQCWGNNYNGQLGDGTTTNSVDPVLVQGLSLL